MSAETWNPFDGDLPPDDVPPLEERSYRADTSGTSGTSGPSEVWAASGSDADELNGDHEERRLRAYDADELEAVPMTWLAPGWLPKGSTAVLVGDEGIGKSLWWVRVAAALTSGSGDDSIALPPSTSRNVLLVLTEDTWGEVRSRLEVAGANLAHVQVLCDGSDGAGHPILPGIDVLTVYEAALACDAALIVVDAWLDTVAAGLDVRDTQKARRALAPWANIAQKTGACCLLLAHTNRLGTTNTRDKVGGTIALRQKSRVLLYAATPDGDRGNAMFIGPDKVNNTAMSNAQQYQLDIHQARPSTPDDPGTVARLGRCADAGAPIGSLVSKWARDEIEARKPASSVDKLTAWLDDHMRTRPVVGGAHHAFAADVKAAAVSKGFSKSNVRDHIVPALHDLGGDAGPEPGRQSGPHIYTLPVDTSGSNPSPGSTGTPGSDGSDDLAAVGVA